MQGTNLTCGCHLFCLLSLCVGFTRKIHDLLLGLSRKLVALILFFERNTCSVVLRISFKHNYSIKCILEHYKKTQSQMRKRNSTIDDKLEMKKLHNSLSKCPVVISNYSGFLFEIISNCFWIFLEHFLNFFQTRFENIYKSDYTLSAIN